MTIASRFPARSLSIHYAKPALLLLTLLGCSGAEDGSDQPAATTGGGGMAATAGGASSGSGGAAPLAGNNGVPQAGVGGSGGAQGGGAQGGSAQGGGAQGGSAQGGSGGAALSPGETLYILNCGMCHADRGAGGAFAPEIQHPVRDYSTWVVRNGRAVTPYPKPMEKLGPDKLSDADLALIYDYLDKPPQPTTGQALYLDYCGNCHGADGQGGPTMRPIVEELAELKMQVRNGTHPGEFDMRREYMPALDASRLSDAELQLIYDYVDSL